jgi:tetratricopeptide (TPR) repeat protein
LKEKAVSTIESQPAPPSPLPAGSPAQDVHSLVRREMTASALKNQARKHYQLGNRFFDFRVLDRAAEEWRRASWMWRLAAAVRPLKRERLTDLRAVILLLLTVLLLFNLVYGLFPRNPADLAANGDEEEVAPEDGRGWWERWLDTGHPAGGGAPVVTLRDWWLRIEHRWQAGADEPTADQPLRPDLDERWPDLMSQYRKPDANDPVDYRLIAGYGYLRNGDYRKSIEAFQAGIGAAKQPKHGADLYQGLANAYYYSGFRTDANGLAVYNLKQVLKASEAYEVAITAEPRALSIGNLGWMYFLLGQYDKAAVLSLRALRMEKNLHYVRLNLGLIYLVQAQNEDAFETYRQVIRAQPEEEILTGGIDDLRTVERDRPGQYPFADLMLGLLARAKGDPDTAARALRRFLAVHPAADRWQHLAKEALSHLDSPMEGL